MEREKEETSIPIISEVTLSQLLDTLLELEDDQLIKFITEIDDLVGEWDFTMKLYNHFYNLKLEYDRNRKR